MKRLILSIAMSVMVLAANLASGQDVKAIYGRIESISDRIVTVNNTIIALPEKVSVYRTDGSSISLSSLKTGDYVSVTLLSTTEAVIKIVAPQEADRYMPLDVR